MSSVAKKSKPKKPKSASSKLKENSLQCDFGVSKTTIPPQITRTVLLLFVTHSQHDKEFDWREFCVMMVVENTVQQAAPKSCIFN